VSLTDESAKIDLLRALNAYARHVLRAQAPSVQHVRVWVLLCLLRMELRE